MNTKELKEILRDNRNVKIIIDDEWVMTRNIDSMAGQTIYIEHTYNVDKWYSFESSEYNKAIKFFMTKIAYCKRFRKIKNNCNSKLDIKIKTN